MVKNPSKILLFLLISIIVNSCGAFGPLTTTSTAPPEKIEKLALLSTYLTFRQSAPSLSIRNSIMSENIRSFSGDINNLLITNINNYRETVANALKENLKCSVIYGKNLQEMQGFNELKNKYNFTYALKKEDEFFPDIISDTLDLIPFEFENGDIEGFFKEPGNFKNIISEICKKLDLNNIAVSYSYLFPIEGASIVLGNSLNLASDLYIFNKDGECIIAETGFTNVTFKSKELEGYQEALDNLPVVLKYLIEKKVDEKFIDG